MEERAKGVMDFLERHITSAIENYRNWIDSKPTSRRHEGDVGYLIHLCECIYAASFWFDELERLNVKVESKQLNDAGRWSGDVDYQTFHKNYDALLKNVRELKSKGYETIDGAFTALKVDDTVDECIGKLGALLPDVKKGVGIMIRATSTESAK